MTNPPAPFSTVAGYGGNPTNVTQQPSGNVAGLYDDIGGFAVVGPYLNQVTSYGLVPIVIDATTVPAYSGLPEINAILIELRVLTALLHFQLGPTNLDLEQMRADEAYQTTPTLNVNGAL